MKTKTVGIIGGGLSGLTAGYYLLNKNDESIDVTIIEKDQKLGGRILSKNFSDCPIEFGAQFFVKGGKVHSLIQQLGLDSRIVPLQDNFISYLKNHEIFPRTQLPFSETDIPNYEQEFQQIKGFAKKNQPSKELMMLSFEEWHLKYIGEKLLSFWNRLFISIGIRNVSSVNAYFGLIMVNVFLGENNLLKGGLKLLISKLQDEIRDHNGSIFTETECINITMKNGLHQVHVKSKGMKKTMQFDKVITAVKPDDLLEFYQTNHLSYLKTIDSYPMLLFAIKTDQPLWPKSWGVVILDEQSPIYTLCDWRNVMHASVETPVLAICSSGSKPQDILQYIDSLFPESKKSKEILYQVKWDTGLHQANNQLFNIARSLSTDDTLEISIAGDWTILPALEGAVVSGYKSAQKVFM